MRRLLDLFLGAKNREREEQLDRDILAITAANKQQTYAAMSGARVLKNMSGAIRMVVEPRPNDK